MINFFLLLYVDENTYQLFEVNTFSAASPFGGAYFYINAKIPNLYKKEAFILD